METIINDKDILDTLFSNLKNKNNLNISETLNLLITLLKLISIEGLKIPSIELEDEVNTDPKINTSPIKNTIFGEYLFMYFEDILQHFKINDENSESTPTMGTYGIKFIPLGIKRYIIKLRKLNIKNKGIRISIGNIKLFQKY